MKNSILILRPYKYYSQWVFDDPSTGLVREAFISGIDKMLDRLTVDIPNASEGFNLLFSEQPFPGYQIKIDWLREEYGGNWYRCIEYDQEGWLCPALFKYFEVAPKTIYARAEESK
jgi:hypothetical protein